MIIMDNKNYAAQFFSKREEFIVLGLTGRIGSGCSSTAKFLEQGWPAFKANTATSKPVSSEDREYRAIYAYAENHLPQFYNLSASNIIITFLFDDAKDKDSQKFFKYLGDIASDDPNKKVTVEEQEKLQKLVENYSVREMCGKFKDYCDTKEAPLADSEKIYNFLSEPDKLKAFVVEFKKWLNELKATGANSSFSTKFLQLIGNNMRAYGILFPDEKTDIDESAFDSIAYRINRQIKLHERHVKETEKGKDEYKEKVHVVIDSLKNIHEATFLRNRYTAFYLVSLNVDEKRRIERLRKCKKRNLDQIMTADICEYPKLRKDLAVKYGDTLTLVEKYKQEKLKKNEENHEFAAWQEYMIFYNHHGLPINDKDDKSETKKRVSAIEYANQDIETCIQSADIHINSSSELNDYSKQQKGILKYVTLIMHPGLVLPSNEERCMQIAFSAKINSGCLSRQVGAVVTDSEYTLRSIGWNDPPKGLTPCIYRSIVNLCTHQDNISYSDYELGEDNKEDSKDTTIDQRFSETIFCQYETQKESIESFEKGGLQSRYCFKDIYNSYSDNKKNPVHTRSIHAEERAFLALVSAGGTTIAGGCLFTTSSPCELCSKKAYELGIKKIYFIEPYPGISQSHVLGIGKNRPEMILFSGAVGSAYTRIYTPVIPIKDELRLRGFDFLPSRQKAKTDKESTQCIVQSQDDKNV
ncbi:hypothetical protein FACS189450_10020 [Spirochaetia bacterium]|nr:hypothetical protein FACS189450_10020 [Spirochaetia bacterium]